MSVLWHYFQNGTTQGPIPEEQLRALIKTGVLLPSDQVWREGMEGWAPIQSLPGLAALSPQGHLPPAMAAPLQPAQGQPSVQPKNSNKVLLWVLGGCGALLLLAIIGVVAVTLWMKRKVGDLKRNPAVAAAEMLVRANPELEVVSTDYAKGTITLRNKKSGETLTMDANEVKKGRFTFKDEKGSEIRIQAAEGGSGPVQVQVPEGGSAPVQIQGPEGQATFGVGTKVQAPSWLPAYRGAPLEGVVSVTGKDGSTGTVKQKTADSPAQVIEAFEKALKADGFEVNTVRNPGGGIVIGEQKALKRQVMATIGASQGQTVATITYRERN